MADTIKNFAANLDGSASFGVVFDVTGMGFDPSLTDNYTPCTVTPNLDANGNPIPWTEETAVEALASGIAASKAAFFAAAPGITLSS